MVHNCICLYMYIVYFHFCGASVIFAVIILCFSVDNIFSAYWWELRVLFVQLKRYDRRPKTMGMRDQYTWGAARGAREIKHSSHIEVI